MDFTLFKEGVIVMIIGMGTVFVFLTIMIWAMNINTLILDVLGKYFPEEIPEVKKQTKKSSNDEEIALAIACAFNEKNRGI